MDLKEWNKMMASEIKALEKQLEEQNEKVKCAIAELYHMMIFRTRISITLSGIAIVLSIIALIIG